MVRLAWIMHLGSAADGEGSAKVLKARNVENTTSIVYTVLVVIFCAIVYAMAHDFYKFF